MTRLAVMQPYFLPYLGYFQLVQAAERFVIYDDVQYSKQSWFNRNRFLIDGKTQYFTIPVKSDSDFLDVREREVAPDFRQKREGILSRLEYAYRKAPCFDSVFPFIREIFGCNENNLYRFIRFSFDRVCERLGIDTEIITSSDIQSAKGLGGKERLYEICNAMEASRYINLPGGQKLYNRKEFGKRGVELLFLMPELPVYEQFNHDFIPGLSILDVMMFNSTETIQEMLGQYRLI
ncbi:WbqC family protein [Rhodohalobacter mucosus]|uniref:WbqC-like protein family protein n=1 Tax=Rhodohalobacter mucosus TaxID=2079485 RepID=A0A316TY99_9BACT|nr:WbqC family protein [Rhodohalobacter mucosus]PWN07822.1 hypothetical protein DDZ15_02080 [Rhodohalobacter mucosus]